MVRQQTMIKWFCMTVILIVFYLLLFIWFWWLVIKLTTVPLSFRRAGWHGCKSEQILSGKANQRRYFEPIAIDHLELVSRQIHRFTFFSFMFSLSPLLSSSSLKWYAIDHCLPSDHAGFSKLFIRLSSAACIWLANFHQDQGSFVGTLAS